MAQQPQNGYRSSPRTWGCFFAGHSNHIVYGVFPTHVGVFQTSPYHRQPKGGLPHARGGVSKKPPTGCCRGSSSPRTWGCFHSEQWDGLAREVFPTHVGTCNEEELTSSTDLSLPHARGGVSDLLDGFKAVFQSSPRTWGCFRVKKLEGWGAIVFPTHVGVFPVKRSFLPASRCLPHARGGVSQITITIDKRVGSSPRTWGCFHSHRIPLLFHTVFPTHVGVFLPGRRSKRHTRSLPHARGGVSMLKADILELEKSSPRTWGCF